MSKPASKIEEEIRRAVSGCSLASAGLWCKMRYVIEGESDRPGHLRRNGRPLSAVQLAIMAGSTADEVARLQQELDDAGLTAYSVDGIHSPMLARLYEVRAGGAERVRRFRVLRNTLQPTQPASSHTAVLHNTACNADVTPNVTNGVSPAPSSLPTPLSLSSPTSPDLFHAGEKRQHEPKPGENVRIPTPRGGASTDEIERIYQAYPRKVGKGLAKRAIDNALVMLKKRGPVTAEGETWASWLLGRVVAYAAATERRIAVEPSAAHFTPHPGTWFNEGRYDDDPAEWEPKNRKDFQNAARNPKPTAVERGEYAEPKRVLKFL